MDKTLFLLQGDEAVIKRIEVWPFFVFWEHCSTYGLVVHSAVCSYKANNFNNYFRIGFYV